MTRPSTMIAHTHGRWRRLPALPRAHWWRSDPRPVSCVVCGLTVRPDDAIGLLPHVGFAHAECALVHMLESSGDHATEQPAGRAGPALPPSLSAEEQRLALLRALLSDDQQ
jgi:hypothetical protein